MNIKQSLLSRLPKRKKGSGAGREFIAKLSKGLMLPIAMLPIAGLFLGIGATIATQGSNAGVEGLIILGNFLKIPGDVIFGALPVLFAIAIAIAFTKDAAAAALSAFVGYLVFSGVQSSLIVEQLDAAGKLIGFDLLFYTSGSLGFDGYGLPTSLFGNVLGIRQLQTSVFGGFIVGFTVAFLYNKFKDIQLPPVLGFFSGVRFIPVVTFGALFPITLLLLVLWPLVGMFFNILGGALGSNMFGFNAFIFGYIERSLVPLGLHHAFYSPLWYSSVGGILDLNDQAI
ncbi:MAG: PTS transporter subunit EIIC, partial [Mycoplasmataceae bacterium]|nr:PTS transporter subunit EIIC [Mycoplasmataceae bacterium]